MIRLLKGIRAQETSYAIRMARIRAFNMALYFFITPLVSFIVFTVVCSAKAYLSLEHAAFNALVSELASHMCVTSLQPYKPSVWMTY